MYFLSDFTFVLFFCKFDILGFYYFTCLQNIYLWSICLSPACKKFFFHISCMAVVDPRNIPFVLKKNKVCIFCNSVVFATTSYKCIRVSREKRLIKLPYSKIYPLVSYIKTLFASACFYHLKK